MTTNIKSYMLYMGLMVHSVTEGLGFGSSDLTVAVPTLIAIIAHKGLA